MSMLDQLRKDSSVNPWLAVADKWLHQVKHTRVDFSGDCIVSSEQDKIDAYNQKVALLKSADDRAAFAIERKILPCPCIGSPDANIWLMFKNPGCSCWDYYDFVAPDEGRRRQPEDDSSARRKATFRVYANDEKEQDALRIRQELAIRQLKFDFSKSGFYVFNEAFRTLDGSSRARCGTYDWNAQTIFPKDGFLTKALGDRNKESWCADNVFELDYHPYRTKRFDKGNARLLETRYWKLLVDYAFDNHKLVVFWGSWVLDEVRKHVGKARYAQAVSERRIVVMKSQSAVFSEKACYFPTSGVDVAGGYLK